MENFDNNQIYTSIPEEKKVSSVCSIIALVCGIVAYFFNPCYLPCLAAVILGIVGLCRKESLKGMAIAGIILGAVAVPAQIIADTIITILTAGLGFFVYFL